MENNLRNRYKLFDAIYESMNEADIRTELQSAAFQAWEKDPRTFEGALKRIRFYDSPTLEKHGIPLSDDQGGE
jgi:hypothetical protein